MARIRPLRVAVISQYYPPEAHGALPDSLAQELARRGHDVRVVTSFPNHPYGRVFPGWRQRLRHVEQDRGVTVRRVPMLPDHSGSAVRRIAAYVSFGISVLTATRFVRGSDVVYVYCAQPTAAIAPMLWRRVLGIPYVLHVQDIWPESVTGSGVLDPGMSTRVVEEVLLRWLRRVHRGARRVVAIAPGAARLLTERGAAPERTSSCLNWGTSGPAVELPRTRDAPGTHIVYAGTIGPNQGLDVVVRAAAQCRDLDGLVVTFVGDGLALPRLRELADTLDAENVRFLPSVQREAMRDVHDGADFELVALRAVPMSSVTIPSKLQDAMAHGVPLIAAVPGDAADLVTDADAGLVVEPEDADALADAFRTAHATSPAERRRLGGNARAAVERHMALEPAIDHMENILREAAA